MDSLPQKRCYACNQTFPPTPEYFSRNKSKKDGLADSCKVCDSARRKAYTKAHKEQEYQSRRRFRDENQERLREERRLYREANKEQIAENKKLWQQSEAYKSYQKRYQQEHADKLSEQHKQKYATNKLERLEQVRQYARTEQGRIVDKTHKHKRRAQKLASNGHYTSKQLQEQLQRQKAKCYYCHAKLGKTYHVEHIVPLARGGSNDISNIVIACPACNMSKHDKLPHEWHQGNRLL